VRLKKDVIIHVHVFVLAKDPGGRIPVIRPPGRMEAQMHKNIANLGL